jgi:hypothetical protein
VNTAVRVVAVPVPIADRAAAKVAMIGGATIGGATEAALEPDEPPQLDARRSSVEMAETVEM